MSDLFEKPAKPVRLTSADMRQAMSRRWAAPEWAIMWEVGRATGAVTRQRYADAVMMSLWPSRGLELHGVEIKVSRADWRREAKDPTKAEEIAAYCDRWWVHVAPGVIDDLSEVPQAWGARVFDGKNWRTLREASATTAKTCDRVFLASLLRRADELSRYQIEQDARRMTEAIAHAAEERINAEIERRSRDRTEAMKKIAEFEEASGLSFSDFMLGGAKEIGALVKAVNALGIQKTYGGVNAMLNQMRAQVRSLESAIETSGLAPLMQRASSVTRLSSSRRYKSSSRGPENDG